MQDETPMKADQTTALASFQHRVADWLRVCFGPKIAADRLERADRLLEEVLELLQATGYPKERVAALRDYVWSRPEGEPAQEVGGTMVTLAAFCAAQDLDLVASAEAEYARISQPEIIEKIRRKQAAKPVGSALPVAAPTARSPRASQALPSDPGNPSASGMSLVAGAMAGALQARRELRIAAGGMPQDEDVIEAMEDAALELHARLAGASPRQGTSALAQAARTVAAAIDTHPLGLNRVLMEVGVTLEAPVRHYFASVLSAYADSLDVEMEREAPDDERAIPVAHPVDQREDLQP